MLRRVARYGAGVCSTLVGAAVCHSFARPLHVVWDLDETLISSEEIPVKDPKPGKEQILRRLESQEIEHVDDDGLHFVTRTRPHAMFMLRFLSHLPGCRQFVSTSASPGYMNNVLALLDPAGSIFVRSVANQSSRGKNLDVPLGSEPDLRRAVLVDNKASCHRPQPQNGVVVTDFVHPSLELVAVDASTGLTLGVHQAACAPGWETLPRGMVSSRDGSSLASPSLMVAERRSLKIAQLVAKAKAQGFLAVALCDPARDVSCFAVGSYDLPVIALGANAERDLQIEGWDGTVLTTLRPRQDSELLSVFRTLLLCWCAYDVRWILGRDASASRL